jgi:hypothetical protein
MNFSNCTWLIVEIKSAFSQISGETARQVPNCWSTSAAFSREI